MRPGRERVSPGALEAREPRALEDGMEFQTFFPGDSAACVIAVVAHRAPAAGRRTRQMHRTVGTDMAVHARVGKTERSLDAERGQARHGSSRQSSLTILQ